MLIWTGEVLNEIINSFMAEKKNELSSFNNNS